MPIKHFAFICNSSGEASACTYRRNIRIEREDTKELILTYFCEKVAGVCKSKIKVEVILPTE